MTKFRFILFFSLILTFGIGCSGGNSPTGNSNDPGTPGQISSLPVGVTDWSSTGEPAGGMGSIGLFNIHVDSENGLADVSSLREATLTDVLEVVDITNFLQLAPCFDCIKIRSVELDAYENVVLSIGIKHPFPAGDPFKPISGRNRADLHVFNVEGMVVSSGAVQSFPSLGKAVTDLKLVNADGYTGYLDTVLDEFYPTDASLHPYITHFDDYSAGNFNPSSPTGFESVTAPPPSGNLVMAMGSEYDFKDYKFNMTGSFDFIFAVGCTYAVSAANKSQRFQPEYRIPQHNKKAASEVSVSIVNNELAAFDTTSSANIEIKVVDINHGVPVGSALNEMFADSSVGGIDIEVPGVTSSPVHLDGNSSISGTGHDPSDPLVFNATITNSASSDVGIYSGLVKVLDTYLPGQNVNPLLNGKDGIKRVGPIENPLTGTFAITEFATWQVFEIEVMSGNDSPTCDLQVSSTEVGQGATITADPGTSIDPDGLIISYEYDTDYDGVTFNVDVTQNSVDPDFGQPVTISLPCNTTGNPLIVTVALRVCDNGSPSRCTICTQDITITSKLGAIGDVTVTAINRGEGGANPQLITSIDIDWEPNPCGVAEYAIERGDGYTGTGWTLVGTTTSSNYKFNLSGNDWDDDIRLRVICRAVVGGDPLSDSDPSEEVFLLFVSNGGYQVPGNTWTFFNEHGRNGRWELSYWYGGGPTVDGWKGSNTNHIGIGPVCWYFDADTFRWGVVRNPNPIPDLVGQKEAFCDGYYQLFQGWPSGMALCYGTLSYPTPDENSDLLTDFEPANDLYGTGIPYTVANVEGLNHEFGETDQGGFQQLAPAPLWWGHLGFYLNDLLDEDRDYIAIGIAVGSTPVQPNNCIVGWNDGFVYVVD